MKPTVFFFTLMFILFASDSVSATAQVPDKIVFKGKTYSLHTNPMDIFFAENPDKFPESQGFSTALWRGYVATFEIEGEWLCVKDIEVIVPGSGYRSAMEEVFPDNKDGLPVTWFTGLLVLPHGKLKNYIHMGYASEYSKYTILEINQGRLTKEKNLSRKEYRKFRNEQFEKFKNTDLYREQMEEMKESTGNTEEFLEGFLRIYVIDYLSEILD